jgi:hypothetical protein
MNKQIQKVLNVLVQLGIPTGNTNPTANPSNALDGSGRAALFFNRTKNALQIWNGTAWVGTNANYIRGEHLTGAADGTNTIFNLANVPLAGTESIYITGLFKDPATDYTINGTAVTFTTAPANGAKVLGSYTKA